METIEQRVGALMRKVRELRKNPASGSDGSGRLRQEDVAVRMGKKQAAVQRWEAGDRHISAVDFIKWAEQLSLTAEEWAEFRALGVPADLSEADDDGEDELTDAPLAQTGS